MRVDSQSEPISTRLLRWYDASARTLPWRIAPGSGETPDPYRVWLAEVMLQQTGVLAAGRYWRRFLELWPTVQALAAADDADVMREWAGLGYYARARNLLAAARVVAGMGGFPETEVELRALPGIGPYTAAAVAAIAFGRRATAIDANVERVACRLFALETPLPAGRKAIESALSPHVPADRPGDFTQAMMDLGATICTPRGPRCLLCPLQACCAAAALGTPEAFPVKAPKAVRPQRQGHAWWIEHDGNVALVRRPPKGLLGGMLALPGTGWSVGEAERFPFDADWQPMGAVRHVFTHFELSLRLFRTQLRTRPPLHSGLLSGEQLIWTPRESLAGAGLPTLYARALALIDQLEAEPA